MADHLTKDKRSWNMSRIRSKNTAPELIVRKQLHNIGIRFRLYAKDLPGKPDICNRKKKFAIFVNGCFWHQHPGCKRATTPQSNQEYWLKKLETNVKRFNDNLNKLKKSGYNVFVIWECEVGNKQTINDLTNNIKKL